MNRSLRFVLVAIFALFALSSAGPSLANGSGGTVHVKGYTKKDGTYVPPHDRKAPETKAEKSDESPKPAVATAADRDANGRIKRSEAAKHVFEVQTGYPKGRPGYVVDHIIPLACGGADAPSNMQWQTVADGKAKDATERIGCR